MTDERFRALATDPRYRLPSRKKSQTAVDPRFGRLFTDDGFSKKANVDRYGRKISNKPNEQKLRSRFRIEDKPARAETGKLRPASEHDSSEDETDAEQDTVIRDPAREGFSGSSSDESTSDEESDYEEDLAVETAGNEQTEEVPMGEVSRRIAIINLDWDNVRAMDIMAVAQSFVPPGGKVTNTTIYPSEFGRERLEKEELEGPPQEIFANSKNAVHEEEGLDDSDEDERIQKQLLQDQAKDSEDFDTAKLRQYQLDRLRYYYAVVTCDTESTAKALYDNMDGREYLTSANFFDLRFIPPETTFDEVARDECNKLPDGYKPNEFRTEALTHSKVRLTWDDDDTTRKEVQKRAFSRAEMDEEDLRAYIGSDSSDADTTVAEQRVSKRDASKAKMRAALGLSEVPSKPSARTAPVGDMQITFSAGLSGKSGDKVFENEPQDEESTKARYIRKERDRRQMRKERMKAAKGQTDRTSDDGNVNDDAGFDDPFFNDPEAAGAAEKKARKAVKEEKRKLEDAEKAVAASRRAELELLMVDDDANAVQHFDMKEIEKSEKLARRKKKDRKKAEADIVKDDFQLETEDPRFKQLFDSHEYAIDPSNPKFKATSGMKALLEEGRRKRKTHGDEQETAPPSKKAKSLEKRSKDADLDGIVARIKSKSSTMSKR